MANLNFAKKIIGGRLTSSPELRSTSDGTMCTNFTIAVNFKGKDGVQRSDFFECTAWKQTADFVVKFFQKGSSIFAVGTPHIRKWTDKNGVEKEREDMTVSEVYFVDSKGEMPSAAPAAKAEAPKYEELDLEQENLPF